MARQGVCQTLYFAVAVELYWPYFAYCCALCAAYTKVLWAHAKQAHMQQSFVVRCTALLKQALWRMLFKAMAIWLVGGSLLLAAGDWLCRG